MSPRRVDSPRVDGWRDPLLGQVAARLGDEAGLSFPDNRRLGAEEALRAVMGQLGASDATALDALVRRSPGAREAAIAALTIGETYFFRDANQLALLERVVLPALARRPGEPAKLRMWSAGCASGEEAYTLAMIAREAGWSAGVDVLGTDVAPARLAAARRARYGRWSMRGVSPERVARWFRPQGHHWVVIPEVARDVRVQRLNLADDGWPSAESGIGEMDVVFCRNVLIYFDAKTVAGVARRLIASLAPDGWLFLGASDPLLSDIVPCTVVQTESGLLYRPASAPPAPARARSIATPSVEVPAAPLAPVLAPPSPPRVVDTPVPQRALLRADMPATPADDAIHAVSPGVDPGGAASDTWTLLVRALANQGKLRDARRTCAAALARFPMEVELHLMHATLLLADDRAADAVVVARRALYLDRAAPMAHLLLGDALARAGDRIESRRAFRAAARLLSELPADALVPYADGEHAGRLLRVARFRAASMADDRGGVS